MVTKAVAASVVGCALLILPARAKAQDAAGALGQGFGAQGQLALSSEANLSFDRVNHGPWILILRPSADYFLAPSISGGLVLSYVQRSGDIKAYGAGARVGYSLNVTPNVGIWPKVGILYEHDTFGTATGSTTWISTLLPFLFLPAQHFFVGAAPYYNLKIAGDGEHDFGFTTLFGGWL
jgi:hypothetical protein